MENKSKVWPEFPPIKPESIKKTVSFKVLDTDRVEITKAVRKLLKRKGYKLYEKN
jgi:hypothetical protein